MVYRIKFQIFIAMWFILICCILGELKCAMSPIPNKVLANDRLQPLQSVMHGIYDNIYFPIKRKACKLTLISGKGRSLQ
jgi:hypothetical protein